MINYQLKDMMPDFSDFLPLMMAPLLEAIKIQKIRNIGKLVVWVLQVISYYLNCHSLISPLINRWFRKSQLHLNLGVQKWFLGYGNGFWGYGNGLYHIVILQVFHIFCQNKFVAIALIHVSFSCFYNCTISYIFFDENVNTRLINATPRFMLVY